MSALSSSLSLGSSGISNELAEDAKNYFLRLAKNEHDASHPKKVTSPQIRFQDHDKDYTRCFIKFTYKFKNLSEFDQKSPAGKLLASLGQRISQLGFESNEVEVRLEKGLVEHTTPYWHIDGPATSSSIITSFSNRNNWSTRLLSFEKAKEILNLTCDYHVAGVLYEKGFSGSIKNQLDDHSETAKLGDLYNAKALPHRTPTTEDLSGEVDVDDYRLFICFKNR